MIAAMMKALRLEPTRRVKAGESTKEHTRDFAKSHEDGVVDDEFADGYISA